MYCTIVSKTTQLHVEDNLFYTIISTDCFEHDPEYKESLIKIYKMLKPNGLFCFTCASTGRAEHGTSRTSPCDSYGTIGNIEGMTDYYKNLTEIDVNEVLNLNALFRVWDTYYNIESHDLYFVGIKNDLDDVVDNVDDVDDVVDVVVLDKYNKINVTNTSSCIMHY
jgi:hypothetical protein